MNIIQKVLVVVLVLSGSTLSIAQTRAKVGVVNGMADYLPAPEYPQEAANFCAGGNVEVEVLIGKYGNVLQAKALSGDKSLIAASMVAAKKARFENRIDAPPVRRRGILVYNFDSHSKCIKTGIVNRKAISIQSPYAGNIIHPGQLRIDRETTVIVEIVIDEGGSVISARATAGHPLIRTACEQSARKAKFAPAMVNGPSIKVRATLVYKFKPDGTIEY